MKKSLVILTFISICFTQHIHAQDWELASEKNNIKVYTRLEEGSSIKAFKAEKDFDFSVSEIAKVLRDIASYPVWYDHCKSAAELSKEGDSFIYHMEFSMPFPFNNRDVVNQTVIANKKGALEINFQQIANVKDDVDGVVRMPISKGNWILTQGEDGVTHVSHQYQGDPAGNVPSSIVNMFLVAGPINTLTQLEEYLDAK